MTALQHFGVIGGGAWGTALAQALLRAGRDVTLCVREAELAQTIHETHENVTYLPGVVLDPRLKVTHIMADLKACDAWLLVVPVQHMRLVCAQLQALDVAASLPLILCSKGIEIGTLKLPTVIVEEALSGHPLAVLSGPSFAVEVAKDQPTAVTLACGDEALGLSVCHAVGSLSFRPYYSPDLIGAQIGGAIKNVIAVATGIAAGCQMGENARAALITRGLAEIRRLGAVLGARDDTLMGLCGLGDLVLTCSSTQSRNMSLGFALGQGRCLSDILAQRKSVAEGVPTTAAAAALAQLKGVDMPIVMAVDSILNGGMKVGDVIAQLLSRPLKSEQS
ncbi:MAG: NAD(P)-dependent glycerol-3-phosphate dehydrogenase [Alphaproteobacteria bacterium]|nr:NAD(P)-dependent glycerol-3-phosphate dehydrogenase [Alphaproteobacteria bacterium]